MTGWTEARRLACLQHNAERRPHRHADLVARVDRYIQEHPGVTANTVNWQVKGRRRDVLEAYRTHDSRFPTTGEAA